jgi:hypothetical protein
VINGLEYAGTQAGAFSADYDEQPVKCRVLEEVG